uniref:Maltodextrin-binding protein n=1 Tax=Geobacillus sp. (strain WCH70) TaxID=471223 RepID=C5D6S6_GEOSW
MKKKRRGISILAVMVLVFSLLAACGPTSSHKSVGKNEPASTNEGDSKEIKPEKGAKLKVWESGGAIGEWTKYVAEEFTKKYGVPVTFEEVGHTDAPEKLKTDGPAGLAADVFAAPHDHLGSMVPAGLVLENFFPEEYQDKFMKSAIEGTTVDGTLYGYPTSIETYALFYNKDLVKKLPKTMDELITQAKELTDIRNNKYGFMMEVANLYFVYSFIGGYGGYVFGDNNTNPKDIGLNNEGAVKAGKLMQRIHKEILPLKVEDITYDVKQSLFNEGKLAFNIDGPWAVAGHRDAGVNFGVIPLPKLENGQTPTSFSGIRAFYVNAYTKYPNAASLFAKFATSEEMLLKRFEMTGQLPPVQSLLDNETIKNDEIASAFLEQAKYAVPMPNIPQMPMVWEPMASALTTIWNDGKDPKEALDAAVDQIKAGIATQGQ